MTQSLFLIAQELFQSSGAVIKSRWPSWASGPNDPYGFRGRTGLISSLICQPTSEDIEQHNSSRSCVKVEVSVLGSPSLHAVSVDVKQH